MNMHNSIGRKIAGTKFMILSFVIPSILRESPIIMSEPTQVISETVASVKYGAM